MTNFQEPWTLIDTDENGDLFVRMGQGDGHKIFFGNIEDTCGFCHANARLTAKAPELLKMLIEILRAYRVDASTKDEYYDSIYKKAKTLIEDATQSPILI